MSRRVRLPAADDLFRPTSNATEQDSTQAREAGPDPVEQSAASEPARREPVPPEPVPPEPVSSEPGAGPASTRRAPARRPSGRVRHDEKMTVYITSDELLDLEHTRLLLRRSQGMAVDRGRLVRSAIAIALADYEQNGDDSVLVQRLRDQ